MFIFATAASFFATQLFLYTVVVWIASTGKSSLSALFYGLAFLPFLLFSRVIGRLADRLNRLLVVFLAHIAITLLFAGTFYLHDAVSSLTIVSIGALFGTVFIFIPSFRYALIADFYPKQEQPGRLVILNAISVMSLSCSPLLHLVLMSVSAELPLIASAALMAFATLGYLCMYLFRAPPTASLPASATSPQIEAAPAQNAQTGAVFFCVLGIAIIGPLQSLVPGLLLSITHSETLRDLLMPAVGAGLIASSVLLKLTTAFDRERTSQLLTGLLAFVAVLLASAPNTLTAGIALFLVGALAGTLVNWNQTVIQMATPHHAQGQLMSFFAALNMGVPALFSLLVGAITLLMPIDKALLAIPAFLLLALGARAVCTATFPHLFRLEERK